MGIYTGSDLAGLPNSAGAYALVNSNLRAHQKKISVIYIGHAGGGNMSIKARLKTHLVELTGTWTNGKHPASIDLDQVDKVFAWTVDELRDYAPEANDKTIAEALEIIAKQHENLTPVMITDSKPPTNAALELSQEIDFHSAAIEHISNGKTELILPSRSNLVDRIKTLELNHKILEIEYKKIIDNLTETRTCLTYFE